MGLQIEEPTTQALELPSLPVAVLAGLVVAPDLVVFVFLVRHGPVAPHASRASQDWRVLKSWVEMGMALSTGNE